MGPRGSALACGYTNYHQLLENSLAELKMKEVFISAITVCFHFLVYFVGFTLDNK